MPLWYLREGDALLAWTYGKSQKVRNLERDPRATLQLEAGRDVYGQLRGVMLECDVAIEPDIAADVDLVEDLAQRHRGAADLDLHRHRRLTQRT